MDSVDLRDSNVKIGSVDSSSSSGQSPGSSAMARECNRSSGGSDRRRIVVASPVNISPDHSTAQSLGKQAKKSALHPSSFIKGKSLLHRRTSSVAVTSMHDTSKHKTATTTASTEHPFIDSKLRNRHSFDGLHDSPNVAVLPKMFSTDDRRRSSVDIGVIADIRKESRSLPLKSFSEQHPMEVCEPSYRQEEHVLSDSL